MKQHLSLVTCKESYREKRTFPRFPFPSMTFKAQGSPLTFQVSNISPTGMRIQLKDGTHKLKKHHHIKGSLHWQGHKLPVQAQVVWSGPYQLGLSFQCPQKIENFLSLENILKGLKPLHLHPLEDEERPAHLKYWLKSAPVWEIFVWGHGNGEYQKIQVLFGDHFIEWKDGQGLQTGKLLREQGKETPLNAQDEWVIEIDQVIEREKLSLVCDILQNIPEEKIQKSAKEFILIKLSAA